MMNTQMQMQPQGAGFQGEPQLLCLELSKRMEELYPVLLRAGGNRSGAVAPSALPQGFVAYSYSASDNPQLLAQANSGQFNPAVHVDYTKWAQAVQNNPDPQSCYPEPLVGLPALEARMAQQQKALEDGTRALDELRTGFGNLKDHLEAKCLMRLEECRSRHKKLSRQLLQVVTAVETYAIRNGAARRNPQVEARLEERFAKLEESVHAPYAPSSARSRVEELSVVLRGLLEHGTPAGGAAASITEAEAKRVLEMTASQGEALESLQEELALRKRDNAQFESALERFAASSRGQAL
eukprot:TRINITY_DN50098_c0_g1_i1.p1 TRINITY_DN50098_c0_g1~~TRINITY_DN50098_c0_g1_i1.p1  ORF type:complete len:296 (-),score=51.22 TRINITY_DN50098_c0_g1_i1:118-1005(-)